MARSLNKEKKLVILQLVKHKKAVLFGSFQNNSTQNGDKIKAWTEILIKAQSLGLAKANRSWTYARDHLFGQWKSRTLAKRNNARKTGTGGGKQAILDCVDEDILSILGSDSAIVEGLGLPEAGGVPEADGVPEAGGVSEAIGSPNQRLKSKINKRKAPEAAETINSLKIKLLKTEIYKNQLEILKLEREMKIPLSIYTQNLLNANSGSVGDISSVEENDYRKADHK